MNEEQVDIQALASLARLDISDEESASLEKDMHAILGFVREVQEAGGEHEERPVLRNVMREDAEPHESGLYTESLLAAAPVVKDGRVVVKHVVSRT